MSPDKFNKEGERLFGAKWRRPLADALEITSVTVWRYSTGLQPIPRTVELAMQSLEKKSRARRRG